jgi:hypothetical protein
MALALAPAAATTHPALAPLPNHFAKPPHSSILKEHFKGKNQDYLLKVASNKSAITFWKKELSEHGWTVKVLNTDGLTQLRFKGHGYGGKDTDINFISKDHAAVLFHKLSGGPAPSSNLG